MILYVKRFYGKNCYLMSQLFRKKALENISAPDDIDQTMRLADRKGWIALLSLVVCLVFAGFWSWYGRIPVTVSAGGLILREGGLKGIVTIGEGQIEEVFVSLGENIRRGQIVARIYRPDMLEKLHNAYQALENAKEIHEKLESFVDDRISIHDTLGKEKLKSLRILSGKLKEQEDFLSEHLEHMQNLRKNKIITPVKVQEARVGLTDIINRINTTGIDTINSMKEQYEVKNDSEIEVLKSAEQVAEHQREVAELLKQIEINCTVVSQLSGRVVEIRTKPGNVVRKGQIIAMLENPDEKKSAVFFLSGVDGKRVKSGMTVRVYPSTTKKEEYGGIMGLVTWVSPYSTSPETLTELLGNQTMVEQFIKQAESSPIIAVVDLIPAADTVSGYRWTSSSGSDTTIETGTMVQGEVTVEKRRPLSLVLPIIKHIFGM